MKLTRSAASRTQTLDQHAGNRFLLPLISMTPLERGISPHFRKNRALAGPSPSCAYDDVPIFLLHLPRLSGVMIPKTFPSYAPSRILVGTFFLRPSRRSHHYGSPPLKGTVGLGQASTPWPWPRAHLEGHGITAQSASS